MNDLMKERQEKEILFSKTVKAGRRIYYFDVKKDRNDGMYISITESKRVKEGTKDARPVLEKHKIFLYREDMEKFASAFDAVAGFVEENSPAGFNHLYGGGHPDFVVEGQQPEATEDFVVDNGEDDSFRTEKSVSEFRFDIDF